MPSRNDIRAVRPSGCRFAGIIVATVLSCSANEAAAASSVVPFQKTRISSCDEPNVCHLDFGTVGSKRVVRIESVSCLIESSILFPFNRAEIIVGEKQFDGLVPVRISGGSTDRRYALNHQTNITAKTGDSILILIETPVTDVLTSLECKVAGKTILKG